MSCRKCFGRNTNEEDIVGLHDDGEGHDKSPERGHGVCLHSLPDAHVMLSVLRLHGLRHEGGAMCFLGEVADMFLQFDLLGIILGIDLLIHFARLSP